MSLASRIQSATNGCDGCVRRLTMLEIAGTGSIWPTDDDSASVESTLAWPRWPTDPRWTTGSNFERSLVEGIPPRRDEDVRRRSDFSGPVPYRRIVGRASPDNGEVPPVAANVRHVVLPKSLSFRSPGSPGCDDHVGVTNVEIRGLMPSAVHVRSMEKGDRRKKYNPGRVSEYISIPAVHYTYT